ncbi:MAG: alginate lyase family protein [Terriglobales bacterium]|jgi:hypothetical protein
MRTMLWLSLVVSIAFTSSIAMGEDFALVSEAVARSLPSKADTPAAKATLTAAMSELNRSPNAISTIETEGRLPSDPVYAKSKTADNDLAIMCDLALAYRLTGDKKYLDATTRFIQAWANTYQTHGDPIDDQDFFYFFITHDLVHTELPPNVQAPARKLILQFAQTYVAEAEKEPKPGSPEADPNNPVYQSPQKPDPTRINNFQSHRIKLATLAAFASGEKELIRRARAVFERHIAINIDPDGSVLDFHTRDALDYATYDLEPLLLTAVAAHEHAEDWFGFKSPAGSSLGEALLWLTPFAEGEKTHQEFVHSTVPFDQTRAKAGVAGFSGLWNPKGSTTVFAYGAILNQKYRKVLADVETRGNTKTPRFVELLFY